MTSKRKGMWLMLLAGIVLAGAVMVATAGQKTPAPPPAPAAPRAAAAPEAPEAPMPPEPGEEFFFIEDGRAWLGVTVSDINAEKARELKLGGEYGALVESVAEESPAAKVGVQEGDVITGFGGERVRSVAHLTRLVRETPAGRKMSLEVMRGGQSRTFDVALEARRMHFAMPEIAIAPRVHVSPRVEVAPMPRFDIEMQPGPGGLMAWSRGPRLGVMTDEIDGQLAEYFGVKQGQGVLVKEVMEGSAAAKAGLKAGDVIIRLNDKAVNDVGDLREALNQAESKDVTLTIIRDRREQTLKVTLDEPQPRRPRRTAEIEQQAQQIARAMQEHAAEVERQVREQLEQAAQQVAMQSKAIEQQVRERVQAQIEQRQLRKQERLLQERMDSPEFQQRMRELEKRMREAERGRDVI